MAVEQGFRTPECVVPGPAGPYVSNIDTDERAYWADDGTGFISLLAPNGATRKLRWADSSPSHPLHAPKGMCLLGHKLYVADNARVVVYDTLDTSAVETIAVPGAQQLNDVATDGQAVYVSDSAQGVIYRLGRGDAQVLRAPESVNGIAFHRGAMFAVSWGKHDVYQLDPRGKEEPVAFGLDRHFVNLDGIEVLADGTFVVSDFFGHKVCSIAPDRQTVRVLAELESPADIGVDRLRSLLYVPQFMRNTVAVYRLVKR